MKYTLSLEQIAKNANILASFCGKRDLEDLTPEAVEKALGQPQVDVAVLFGASILRGGDVFAQVMKRGLAKIYVIVGGEGHTTQTLRDKMHVQFPEIQTDGLPEAQVFARYLKHRYGLEPDYLECRSTNCGNNITNLLELLEEAGVSFRSILLMQDATMQRRMEAGLRKHVSRDVKILNFPVYTAELVIRNSALGYREEIWGMWDTDRYIHLLMGEIPRLTDDVHGYGPNGKGFIAHVDIPAEVKAAFDALCRETAFGIREANPQYASGK